LTTLGRIRTGLITAAVVTGFAWTAQPVQGQFAIAPEGTYNNHVFSGSFGLGGRGTVELPTLKYVKPELAAAYVYYFPSCPGSTCSWWEAQGMLLLYSPQSGPAEPYFGVGVAYHKFDLNQTDLNEDDIGIDLMLGTKVDSGSMIRPYFELRYKIMNDVPQNQWAFTFGLRFGN